MQTIVKGLAFMAGPGENSEPDAWNLFSQQRKCLHADLKAVPLSHGPYIQKGEAIARTSRPPVLFIDMEVAGISKIHDDRDLGKGVTSACQGPLEGRCGCYDMRAKLDGKPLQERQNPHEEMVRSNSQFGSCQLRHRVMDVKEHTGQPRTRGRRAENTRKSGMLWT